MPALAELAVVFDGATRKTLPVEALPDIGWNPASTPRRRHGESGRARLTRLDEAGRLRSTAVSHSRTRKGSPLQITPLPDIDDPCWRDVALDGILVPRDVYNAAKEAAA